jgi:hypothetical protein
MTLNPSALPVNLYAIAIKANAPWRSFQEFVADAKQNPGKIRVSVSGLGTVGDLSVKPSGNALMSIFTSLPEVIFPLMNTGYLTHGD